MKTIWSYLNGKKTILAEIYWGTVMPGLMLYYPDGIPGEINKLAVVIGFFLTSIGLGHKYMKNKATEV
jgi:hypothetical protein